MITRHISIFIVIVLLSSCATTMNDNIGSTQNTSLPQYVFTLSGVYITQAMTSTMEMEIKEFFDITYDTYHWYMDEKGGKFGYPELYSLTIEDCSVIAGWDSETIGTQKRQTRRIGNHNWTVETWYLNNKIHIINYYPIYPDDNPSTNITTTSDLTTESGGDYLIEIYYSIYEPPIIDCINIVEKLFETIPV